MGKKGTKASNIFQTLKGAGAWTSKDSKGPIIKNVGKIGEISSPLKVYPGNKDSIGPQAPKDNTPKGIDNPSTKLPEGKFPKGVTTKKQGPKTEGQVENEKMLAPPKDEKTNEKKDDGKPYVKKGGKATGKMEDYALNSQERYDEYEARGWKHDETSKVKPKVDDKKDDDVNVNTNTNTDTDTDTDTNEDKRTENEKKLDDAKKNLSDAKDSRKQKRKDNRAKRKDKRIGNRADRKNRRAAKIKAGDNAAGVDTGKKRTDKIVNRALDAKEKGDTKQSDRLKKKLDRKGIKVTKLENDSPAKTKEKVRKAQAANRKKVEASGKHGKFSKSYESGDYSNKPEDQANDRRVQDSYDGVLGPDSAYKVKKKDPAGINPKGKPAKKGQPGAKAPRPKRRKVKRGLGSKMKDMRVKKGEGPDHGKKSPAKIAPLIAAAAPALIKGAAGAIGSNLGKKIS